MTAHPGIELVHRFFSGTGYTYEPIATLCTFGFDRWWKREILKKIPKGSVRIMDQGCGTGLLTFQIARRFPRSRIVGLELRDEYLTIAREKARDRKISNVEFILGRAEDFLTEEKFDCITSSYLAKYVELRELIGNIQAMLQEAGVVILHDFTYPRHSGFARIWEFYFRLLQAIGSRIFPQWKTVFQELPALIRERRWMEEAMDLLVEYGFREIQRQTLTGGSSGILSARKGTSSS